MKIGITYEFKQNYLPNNRCKNPRLRRMVTTADIEIKEVSTKNFPVAFRITDYKSRDKDYKLVTDEIRTFKNKLYTVWRVPSGTDTGRIQDITELQDRIKWRSGYEYAPYNYKDRDQFIESKSIIIDDNREMHISNMQEEADRYLVDDTGLIWEETGEPMYHILTFGLGHNHGGTGFFIDYSYNPNCSAKNYFNAIQYEEACEYFDKVASDRGDTESIGKYKDKYIEVIMPEMVTRNPAVEHAGGGDPFIEALDGICNKSSSATEAGLLTMAYTMANVATN